MMKKKSYTYSMCIHRMCACVGGSAKVHSGNNFSWHWMAMNSSFRRLLRALHTCVSSGFVGNNVDGNNVKLTMLKPVNHIEYSISTFINFAQNENPPQQSITSKSYSPGTKDKKDQWDTTHSVCKESVRKSIMTIVLWK